MVLTLIVSWERGFPSVSGWEFASECCSVVGSDVSVLAGVGVTALSVATVVCEDVPSDSECDFVKSQSFSLPRCLISLVWKARKT